MYYDSITYELNSLECCISLVGEDRLFFGTDHPFFPPKDTNDLNSKQWQSTLKNQTIIEKLNDNDKKIKVASQNARNFIIDQKHAVVKHN